MAQQYELPVEDNGELDFESMAADFRTFANDDVLEMSNDEMISALRLLYDAGHECGKKNET